MTTMRLTIGFLLVHVASCQSTSSTPVKPENATTFLSRNNKERQNAAKSLGVSMPDLVWDEGLVAQITVMSDDCNDWLNTERSRFVPFKPDYNGGLIINFTFTMLQERIMPLLRPDVHKDPNYEKELESIGADMNRKQISLFPFEFLNPLQTKVGCAAKNCTAEITKKMLNSTRLPFKGNTYAFSVVCLLGPSGVWDLKKLFNKTESQSSSGPPGKVSMGTSSTTESSVSNWSMGTFYPRELLLSISILFLSFH